MTTLKLNIYDKNKKDVVKTYTAEGYDLMLGTVEDLMQIIDIDKLDNDTAVAMMVVKCYKQLIPFIKDIFEGITDDDLKNVKVKEVIALFKDVIRVIIADLGILNQGN